MTLSRLNISIYNKAFWNNIKYGWFGYFIPLRFTTQNLAEKIKGLQGGQTVDISGLMNLHERKSE